MHWLYAVYDNDVATYRSCDRYLWLCTFYQAYSNQTWQNGTPGCTDCTLHMTMRLPPIDHVKNIYGFTSASTSANNSQTWQSGRPSCTDFANDNDVTTWWSLDGFYILFRKNYYHQTWQTVRSAYPDFTLQIKMVSLYFGHVVNIFGFNPILADL